MTSIKTGVFISLTALSLLALLPQAAFAQANSPATTIKSTNPGLLTPSSGQILQKEEKRNQPQGQPETEPALGVPAQPAVTDIQDNQIFIQKFRVEGNEHFDEETLSRVLKPYENRVLTIEEINAAAQKIADLYHEQGYLTTLAYIPPQDVSDGVVVINIQEGKIGNLDIAGNRYYRTRIIARDLEQRPGEALNISELESTLLRINRQHDYRLRATLSAGENPGETDVRLNVEERQPWQLSTTFDNQGRPLLGFYRWGVELGNSNLTGIGDRLSTRWLASSGTQVAVGSYFVPLNRHGTEVGGTFSYSHVNIDLPGVVKPPKITGDAYSYGLLVSQPLDENRHWVIDGGVNFRRINSFFNDDLTSQTDIRSLQTGLSFNKYDRIGRTYARVQNTVAPDWGDSAKFWKIETLLNRIFFLPHENYLIVSGYAQFTPDALPTAEQFQIGGFNSVRGYTEGRLLGDRGYQINVEHRFPVPGLRYASPWLADRLSGVTFFDIGQAWLDGSNPFYIRGTSDDWDQTSLMGAGAGLRAQLTQYLQGYVDFGFALLDRQLSFNSQPSVRVHFGIRSDLLPQKRKTRSDKVTRVNWQGNHRVLTPIYPKALMPPTSFEPVIEDIQTAPQLELKG